MATLEKIRSKSVFLIVVIGVALLAFIIGDAITNSQNLLGDHTTVAKIGKEKIDFSLYQRKREELNQRLEQARKQNPQQYASFDMQLLPEMALTELVSETLLDNAARKAGIRATAEQLRFYIMDNPINPRIGDIIRQLQASGLSVSTPQQAYEIIFNPKRNGLTDAQMAPFQRLWVAMEEETKLMVMRQTYQKLVYNTVKANDLDKRALYNDYVNTSDVEVAYKPYGQLDEKKYPVSDQDLKNLYSEYKNRFKVNETTKDVSFIAVRISPSAADRAAAKKLGAATVAALSDSAATLSRELRKEGVSSERIELRAADLPAGAVKEYVLNAPKDSVKMVTENLKGFTVVKMGKRTMAMDSIQLNLVQVVGQKLPATVLARLNGGLSVDSVSKTFPMDSVMAQTKQWIPLITADGRTGALEQGQLDTLLNAGGRFITLVSNEQGAVLAQVSERRAPVEVYEYELVTYNLNPSVKTVSDERAKLEKFLEENKNTKDFKANAAKAGYTVEQYSLTQSTPAVPRVNGMQIYFPDSRQVVRWAMIDGKPGEVSHIYESKDASQPALYAAAVEAEYEDFVPMSNPSVKDFLTQMARNSKAGDAWVKDYQAKAGSMQSVAQAMAVTPRQAAQFRFGNNAAVRDPKVTGIIAGTKPSQKVKVVKGDDGVYAFMVKSNAREKFPFTDKQYEQQYFQMVNPNMDAMMRGAARLDNRIYKFEAGD